MLCVVQDDAEGNQKEAAQNSIPVSEKSEAGVVYILLERYDGNITLVTNSQQCQPC